MIQVIGERADPARDEQACRGSARSSRARQISLGTDANLTRPAFIRGPIGGLSKRVFDALMAISALIWLLPLFLLLALAIKLHDGGPVLYRHSRIGRNCSRFSCIKFRTMVADAEQTLQMHLQNNPAAAREWQQTRKLKHDPRVTALGSVLRKTSLDELPQLLNIAKGDMSFVGPRPIVAAEIPNYGPAIVAYFRARPGLTGQWQVSGRNDVSYDTRVALDRGYIEDWSFSKDIRILIKTFGVVLRSRGCY